MEYIEQWGQTIPVHRCGALVIGSGCAGYNAADSLYAFGFHDVMIVTEGINMGTSRNTGSDKQTYYKLAWQSGELDSTDKMAQTLFEGRSVHGDIAFAEAANSIRCFLKLVDIGVPFPTNVFGEFVGYQTDHSTEKRATSAGPLTSRYMTEALEKQVIKKGIPIIDHTIIVELITDEKGVIGAIGIDREKTIRGASGLCFFLTDNIVLATGGPAAVYQNRVYPPSQTGMTGMAILAGAQCVNLQEWQYGIASSGFRWNLSGTYQQVIPRYISVDNQGHQREFLYDYFDNPMDAMNYVFQKGYQWPFDSAKLRGSTVIDIILYHEQVHLKRQVFLDYRFEPKALEAGLERLSEEAYSYLKNSDALLFTPICRLERMNPKAIALYADHGIDLHTQMLPITVAAQHCNGGLAVDKDWQTSIPGLYAAGEAAGTFGVYRPGGSALNSTQVGSLRAAEHIAYTRRSRDTEAADIATHSVLCRRFFSQYTGSKIRQRKEIRELEQRLAEQMSHYSAHLRSIPDMARICGMVSQALDRLEDMIPSLSPSDIPAWFKTRDMAVTVNAVVQSMLYAAEEIGTRGGSLCCSEPLNYSSAATIQAAQPIVNDAFDDRVLCYQDGKGCWLETVRPIPVTEKWFETVWNRFNKRQKG